MNNEETKTYGTDGENAETKTAETEMNEAEVSQNEADTAENGIPGIGIGELLPGEALGNEDPAEATDTETVEMTEAPDEPLSDGEGKISGGLKLEGSSWLYIALAIVSALLLILIADKFRAKKKSQNTALNENGASDAENDDKMAENVISGIKAAFVHGIGAREDQQDSYGISDFRDQRCGVMAVVADGMGGLSNGSLVSGILTKTFKERFRNVHEGTDADDVLLETALIANSEVNNALRNAGRSGSTLVSVIIKNKRLHFLTVGDSHLYLCRGGALIQLNREHVYGEELAVKAVNRMVPTGQVKGDRQAKSLTSYYGIGNIPHIDRNCGGLKLIPGDKIMLCTDGVFGTLSEGELEEALSLPINEAAAEIDERIKLADSSYQDNYTAVILEYND